MAGQHGQRAHVSAAGASKHKGARSQPRRFQPPDPHPDGSEDRPLRLHVTSGQRHDSTQARTLVEAWTDAPLSCLIADRAYDGDAFRAWRAQRGIKAVIPARNGRTNPSPTPERYPARNAVARDLGWLKRGRRYDKYARRFLGFLYLAGAWIGLQSYLNAT